MEDHGQIRYILEVEKKTFPHDFSKDFHTFALEWTQTEIKWFIDGTQFHQENINRMM